MRIVTKIMRSVFKPNSNSPHGKLSQDSFTSLQYLRFTANRSSDMYI